MSARSNRGSGSRNHSPRTLCLYWNNVITYRNDLVVRAQVLADTLGKHLASYGSAPESRLHSPTRPPERLPGNGGLGIKAARA